MGMFDAPYPGDERTKNSQWRRAAPRGMRSPDHLWGEYWQRFNLFPIPIFNKQDYFRTAMTIAKDAKSKQDFERKFEELNERRLEELRSLLINMFKGTDVIFSFNCIERFVRVLGDYALELKAQAAQAAQAAEAEAEAEAEAVMEKHNHMEENSLQEWEGISIEDETETLIREVTQPPPVNPEDYEPSNEPEEYEYEFQDLTENGTQYFDDVDWGYKPPRTHESKYGSSKPAPDDDTDDSDDDSQDFVDANETVAMEDGLGRPSSILSKSNTSNSAKKRVRFSDEDEDEDEDVSIHEPKRRKLENPLSPTPTSPTAHVPSSIKQVADAGVSRKRSRPDEEEEEEEEDNGYKRQKIENVPQPPSLISPASSTEDGSASHLARGTSEKVPKERASNNGRRKQRLQKSTSQTLHGKSPRNTLNTRSSRRSTSSTLWELDSSGKSRLI
ncbi:uncharacterized protein Triagg1_2423 [Trichoderma aggressivum f. europaeum]|uniref:Uncharacterized protein n=1 Tax=Trichoderma aggressivum f. europaeum TaxID=173218 RepID=A0AAE1IIQ3_9HYPO|nr:hypothetical protein Triagg1_2423 [Trichoderma aggressivum f. europaeum]